MQEVKYSIAGIRSLLQKILSSALKYRHPPYPEVQEYLSKLLSSSKHKNILEEG